MVMFELCAQLACSAAMSAAWRSQMGSPAASRAAISVYVQPSREQYATTLVSATFPHRLAAEPAGGRLQAVAPLEVERAARKAIGIDRSIDLR